MRAKNVVFLISLLSSLVACGPKARNSDGDDCASVCTAQGFRQCHADGTFDPPVACADDQICDPNNGCVTCVANEPYCGGVDDSEVWQCNATGTGGTKVSDCPGDTVCSNGTCKDACQRALDLPSNVGCDFWAVDLDNEASVILGGAVNDAAAEQFAVAVANNNAYAVSVKITKNAGRVGQAINEQPVLTVEVPANTVKRINLPQREVDGAMGQNGTYRRNSGSGTFVSPHAYHLVSTGPVVAYQFNPIEQKFSNDASTLIPIQALGTNYFVMGYQTANPCGATDFPGGAPEGIPDHGAITIMPIEDGTEVTVIATHEIAASGGDSGLTIPQTPAGTPLTFKLNRYDVANLETFQPKASLSECIALAMRHNGDFTGTQIRTSRPVAVFTSLERGMGFGGATPAPVPAPNNDQEMCCTDHLEEQLLPTTALGREFVVARSPVRSTDPNWKEPDIFRVLATEDGTVVTTTAPNVGTFTLNRGQQRTFPSTVGFTITATRAIMVGQVLVPQRFIADGGVGDPSLLTVPAAEQFRKDYVFLVPGTFRDDFAVLSMPSDAAITLDGQPLAAAQGCKEAPIGMMNGETYKQVICPLADGQHAVTGDKPFGLTVFGYYNVGSYAYVGGSDVKLINPIE